MLLLNGAVAHWAPGFDESSAVFVVIFLSNLYSLRDNARGVESWLGSREFSPRWSPSSSVTATTRLLLSS